MKKPPGYEPGGQVKRTLMAAEFHGGRMSGRHPINAGAVDWFQEDAHG